MDTVITRIIGHIKNYLIAYLTAVMVYGMVFGICIEQVQADNVPTAAKQVEHLHGRTRHDSRQRTTIELRVIEK